MGFKHCVDLRPDLKKNKPAALVRKSAYRASSSQATGLFS